MIKYNKETKRITVRSKNGISIHSPDEILYIEALGNYSKIVFKEAQKPRLIHCPMCKIEKNLDSGMFFRCHKSYIANILNIRELRKGKSTTILLANKNEIPVARRKMKSLIGLL